MVKKSVKSEKTNAKKMAEVFVAEARKVGVSNQKQTEHLKDRGCPVCETGDKRDAKRAKPRKFIVRCDRAGVFYGEIQRVFGSVVDMRNVRKVWYWDGACAVEDLAVNGTARPKACKLTVSVDSMRLLGAVQIIPCTEAAVKCLDAIPEWRAGK